ncbi:MAG: hypothetical protein C0407_16235, partial [Desulfobacca sp.]|nr:hypothetical protein [Desulfobacca sp.]
MLWSAELIGLMGKRCLIAASRDITEHRKVEEKIKQNVEFQNTINTLLRLSLEDTVLEKILEKA